MTWKVFSERFARIPAMTTEAQYVPSLAGGNMLVLEDDNTMGSTASNNFGKPYSGLDNRMWIQQGPDGSTWQIIHDTSGSGGITEQYLYTPQGQVTVITLGQAMHNRCHPSSPKLPLF